MPSRPASRLKPASHRTTPLERRVSRRNAFQHHTVTVAMQALAMGVDSHCCWKLFHIQSQSRSKDR